MKVLKYLFGRWGCVRTQGGGAEGSISFVGQAAKVSKNAVHVFYMSISELEANAAYGPKTSSDTPPGPCAGSVWQPPNGAFQTAFGTASVPNALALTALLVLLFGITQTGYPHQFGHDDGHQDHEWHLRDGQSINGSILILADDDVVIEKGDSTIENVSIQSLSHEDRNLVLQRQRKINKLNQYIHHDLAQIQHTAISSNKAQEMISLFENFNNVTARVVGSYLRVSSYGIPDHPMMIGITNWQRQIPVPQDYTGTNSWSIPLNPKIAQQTIILKDRFLRGAIALAVNGVPIFTARNNRGEFSQSIGELDKWGGHSGRADDYHYHLPPTHLQESVGPDNPIAYAFDGFPIYGPTDEELDECLGRFNEEGVYVYHTINTEPYFMPGIKGVVNIKGTARDGEITPQARSTPLRKGDYKPLRGASVISFTRDDNSFFLEYKLRSNVYTISWSSDSNAWYTFTYTGPVNTDSKENFRGKVSIQKALHYGPSGL